MRKMPLPPYLISASAFLCERILQEPDSVLSAIRIVDVFYVPELPAYAPEGTAVVAELHCLVILKAHPGYRDRNSIEFKLLNTKGDLTPLGDASMTDFAGRLGNDVPGGANITLKLNLGVKNFGTCYICVYLDGEEIIRVPFTLLPSPAEKVG